MIIIGLSGKKRCGKDTFYNLSRSLIKGKICRVAFADPLYEEVSKAVGKDRTFIEQYKDTFRTILQWWGTDFRRKLCNDLYWIDKTRHTLLGLSNDEDLAATIVTDVRFKNEADFIKSIGGYLVRISCDSEHTDNHPSELDLDDYQGFDVRIHNSKKSLEDYREVVRGALKEINNKVKQRNKLI